MSDWLIITACCFIVFLRGTNAQTDIALNKPAFLSSGYQVFAANVNNGATTNVPCCTAQCVQTFVEDAPYWGVDLQGTYKVENVSIVARDSGGCTGLCAQRLANLEIRTGFSAEKGTIGSNNLCTNYSDVIPPDEARTLMCNIPTCGRYLIVQRMGGPTGETFDICQVKVYASATPVKYKTLVSKTKQTGKYFDTYQWTTAEVSSATDCLRLCLTNQENCRSANYYISDGVKMCDINSKALEDDVSYVLLNDPLSTYYSLAESTCN